MDLLHVLTRVVGQDLFQLGLQALDLTRCQLYVGHLALGSRIGLVDQHPGVREGEALAGRAGGQQHRGSRGGLPETDGGDVRLDVLHRVVDGEEGVDVAPRRVDVEADVPVGVLGLQVQQLGADQVGDRVIDRRADEDDVLLEEAGVGVERTLAAAGLFDHRGNEVIVHLEL